MALIELVLLLSNLRKASVLFPDRLQQMVLDIIIITTIIS